MLSTKSQYSWTSLWDSTLLFGIFLIIAAIIFGSFFVPGQYGLVLLVLPFAAPLGLYLILNPRFLLVITVLYMPLETADWFTPFLPPSLTIPKILGFLLLGAVLFHIIFRGQKFRFFDDAQDYLIILFICVISFSGVLSNHNYQVVSEIDRILRLIAFYFAVKNLVREPATMRTLMLGYFLGSLYSSIYSINHYLNTITEWGKNVRAAGIGDNPNNFAMGSSMAIAMGAYLLQASPRLFTKALYGLALAIIAASVVLSGSRGGMGSTAVVLSIVIFRHPKRIQLSLIMVVIAILSFPMWPTDIKSRLVGSGSDFSNTYEQQAEESTQRRSVYLVLGMELLTEYPVLGTGFHTFRYIYPDSEESRFENPLTAHDTYRVAHSLYLETAVGTGFVGLTVLLLNILNAWLGLFQAGNRLERGTIPWATARGLEVALIGFCVSSLVLSSEFFKQFWYMLGMSSTMLYYAKTHVAQSTQSQ